MGSDSSPATGFSKLVGIPLRERAQTPFLHTSSPWILGPWNDVAFVLLTPLLILLAFAAAQRGGWIDGLLAFGLTLAMAHYFPGVLRAYGDRALFQRFRLRLILAPVFLIGTPIAFAYLNLNFIFVVAA